MTSLYKIAEKIRVILGKRVDMQPLIDSVVNAYATIAKTAWYENKKEGDGAIDGVFIYGFKNLVPEIDCDVNLYYIDVPSSYLRLPNELGINQVSFMQGQNNAFVRVGSGSFGIYAAIKAGLLGSNQTYFVEQQIGEGQRMYFPKMTINNIGNILLKLTIALDTVDVEEELNIPPNIVTDIVNMVVQIYSPKTDPVEKIRETLN